MLSGRWGWRLHHPPISHSPAKTPHLNRIDEDALEGLYFGDRRILRCLPYFCERTRPVSILWAPRGILAILGSVWGFPPTQTRAHMGAWNPESRSIHYTRAGIPTARLGKPGRRFTPIQTRQSPSSPPHPQPAPSSPPPSPPAHPRTHTHAPTPTHPHPRAHTHAPTPTRPQPHEKKIKKKT